MEEEDGKAVRRERKHMTVAKASADGLSQTQQMVYLSSGADISGFKMKAIANKMRQKVALQNDRKKREEAEANDPNRGGTYAMLNVADTGPESVRCSEKASSHHSLSPTMKKCIALQSILVHPLSILLLFFPLGLYASIKGWSDMYIFWFNIIAMIPLAKILGDATEELADALQNDTLSGLLNATLGNAVEMILSVQTLRKGLLNVVKATLLGSILSNLLLVLGTSFFLGGLSPSSEPIGKYHVIHMPQGSRHKPDMTVTAPRCVTGEKEQLFTVKGALVNMAMHLLSIMTIALPTVMGVYSGDDADASTELLISRCGAVVITSSYIAYIWFHLVTHKEMLAKDERNVDTDEMDDDLEDEAGGSGGLGTVWSSLLMLVATALIAVSSECLVEAMTEVVAGEKMPAEFIGVILLPFAGNACEHASALRFAMADRPGLSIGIAVGSSTQISLCVVPFAVIMGWCMDKPMDLNFGVQDLTILFLSTLVVLALVLDGRSNWLKGFLLMNAYVFIALLYWFGKK